MIRWICLQLSEPMERQDESSATGRERRTRTQNFLWSNQNLQITFWAHMYSLVLCMHLAELLSARQFLPVVVGIERTPALLFTAPKMRLDLGPERLNRCSCHLARPYPCSWTKPCNGSCGLSRRRRGTSRKAIPFGSCERARESRREPADEESGVVVRCRGSPLGNLHFVSTTLVAVIKGVVSMA